MHYNLFLSQMASINDAVTVKIENLNRLVNAQTNMDKLAQCEIDLRTAKIDPCEDTVVIPQLFVVTLINNNENYNA